MRLQYYAIRHSFIRLGRFTTKNNFRHAPKTRPRPSSYKYYENFDAALGQNDKYSHGSLAYSIFSRPRVTSEWWLLLDRLSVCRFCELLLQLLFLFPVNIIVSACCILILRDNQRRRPRPSAADQHARRQVETMPRFQTVYFIYSQYRFTRFNEGFFFFLKFF